jgi:hypothetical protein
MSLSPTSALLPKTLPEAKNEILRLRSLLGHGPPKVDRPAGGSQPVPKIFPQPQGPPGANPNPSKPGMPGTFSKASDFNLAGMSPKRFAEFLSDRTGPELKLLLSRECGKPGKLKNDSVVAELYKEIKRRKF